MLAGRSSASGVPPMPLDARGKNDDFKATRDHACHSSGRDVSALGEQEKARFVGVPSFRENLFFVGYNHVKSHERVYRD